PAASLPPPSRRSLPAALPISAAEGCGEHRGGGDDHDEAHHEHPGEAAGRATPTRGVDVRLERLARRVDGVGRQRHGWGWHDRRLDRKSTRLNSSHVKSSYAVF